MHVLPPSSRRSGGRVPPEWWISAKVCDPIRHPNAAFDKAEIHRLGLKKSPTISGVLCFLGAAITAASSHLLVMAAGRLIFGMGAESLNVAVVAALARWFKGKELSFAFGVNLTICRLGSFAALNSPTWARAAYANWRWPFLSALGLSAFCIVGAVVYWGMEVQADPPRRILHRQSRLCRSVQVWRELLVYRCPLHHFLLGDLSLSDFRREIFHRGARHVARVRRVPLQYADAVRHDRHSPVRPLGRPHRQACPADDVRFDAADPYLPDDGLHSRVFARAHGAHGGGVLADPCRYVAFGTPISWINRSSERPTG